MPQKLQWTLFKSIPNSEGQISEHLNTTTNLDQSFKQLSIKELKMVISNVVPVALDLDFDFSDLTRNCRYKFIFPTN